MKTDLVKVMWTTLVFGLAAAMLLTTLTGHALEAQKIAEIRGSSETLSQFLLRFPISFEAQIFYALAGSALLGMLGSWVHKWSKGAARGWKHFTLRYVVSQLLWIVGGSISIISTVGFQTEHGEFFGWLSVIVTGGFMGFSGEVKTSDRQSWSPAERAAAKQRSGDDTINRRP